MVYDGSGVEVWRQSGQVDRLHETPRSFRTFVRAQLDSRWEEHTGSDPADSCATGGAFRFYVKRDGHWKAPLRLGGQEVLRCRVFSRWDIPRMNGARQCFRHRQVVRWDP